jgi:hypothetical protein
MTNLLYSVMYLLIAVGLPAYVWYAIGKRYSRINREIIATSKHRRLYSITIAKCQYIALKEYNKNILESLLSDMDREEIIKGVQVADQMCDQELALLEAEEITL